MIDEETILSLSMEAAYKLYILKLQDILSSTDSEGNRIGKKEDYDKIRFGISISFELQDYFDSQFRKKPKDKQIVLYNETFNLQDFRTEIEEREKLLRGTLLKFYAIDKDIIKAPI